MKDNVELRKQDLIQDIESRITALYQQYQSLDRLLDLEKNNVITAEKNSALANELYRSGRATSLDVREAILSETRVRDRLSEVEFRQKLTEINIKNLTGMVFM
jgi:outer membrane protein TolC